MVKRRPSRRSIPLFILLALFPSAALAQQAGGIRGMVYDKDFDAPLPAAQVSIAETGEKVVGTEEGNYVFNQIKPGTYTLVFSKEGYTRQVKADVVVSPGKMTEVNVSLSGEFTDMEEFVVQDVQIGSGEAALLDLRMESPALMDSISSDLMSKAGASDAAGALKLVAGATVQEGKFAVIRGLPDRYVNSQMNGVRLPTADADKRAVQLDQFPSASIESIQVSKTFTPDQQGDASGGAVNVVLKGIPDVTLFTFGGSTRYNTQGAGDHNFLSYPGGGVNNYWGRETRDILSLDGPLSGYEGTLTGAVGPSTTDAPTDYKWSTAAGGKHVLANGITLGTFGSLFYERSSSFYDDGIDDKYWVRTPGAALTPQLSGDNLPPENWDPDNPTGDSFETSLYDITKGSEQAQWGGLGVFGLETENHLLKLLYMYTRIAEDSATLAEDTRGKTYFFPDYNRSNPSDPGNNQSGRIAAPFLRNETLTYSERTTETLQFSGRHILPELGWGIGNLFKLLSPEIDWAVAGSSADLYEYKRQFSSMWMADGQHSVFPFIQYPEEFRQLKPAQNINLGNLQIIEKDIVEESEQYFLNAKFPFEQWSGEQGYLKLGVFHDEVTRKYNQDTFGNFTDTVRGLNMNPSWRASWEESWSRFYPNQTHTILDGPPYVDVDYEGHQEISAWYYMTDLPLSSYFNLIGGARYEDTELSIVNEPEQDVKWYPPGALGQVDLNPGDADVFFEQSDILPSIGFVVKASDQVTLRGSYSETVARQTFKELTPIQQQEYLGADVFIGNPELKMSALKNYDLRLDYTPYDGGLISLSHFYKKIRDPIEYVQRGFEYSYTTPVNYPAGKISGYEIEMRQDLGHFWERFTGLSIGANATVIDSEVTLPEDEAAIFTPLMVPISKRDMTNAPEHLYNVFMTYEVAAGTQLALFYTVRGDTLVAGAGQIDGKFVPSVYETEYGTLNFSLSHKLGDTWSLKFQANNLLDPAIDTVYRSKYLDSDVTKTSYRKGMEFSIGLSAEF